MKLELSDGNIINNPAQSDIDDAISKIGVGLDHCILNDGGNFIQTAGDSGQLYVQYREGNAFFESSSMVSKDQVTAIFRDYLSGGLSWKTMIAFETSDAGEAKATTSQDETGNAVAGGTGPTSFSAESLKNTFTHAAKQETVNSISYLIRRLVRKLFRGFF